MEYSGEEKAIRLLCIDGGFSGLPALFLLDQIFHRLSIDLKGDIKPCEYFDIIVGTGPGGLVALLLGRMEMTVEDAITAYTDLEGCMPQRGERVTDEERLANTERFKRGLETLMRSCGRDASELMQRLTGYERHCRTIICTSNGSQIHLIKSYENRGLKSPRCSLVEAGLAAVAASDTLRPVTISKAYRLNVADASSMCPNPTIEAIKEATKVYGMEKKVTGILSIGGKLSSSHVIPTSDSEKLKAAMSEGDSMDKHIRRHLSNSTLYTRLTVKHESLLGSQNIEKLFYDVSAFVQEESTHRLIDESIKSWEMDPILAQPLSELQSIYQKDWRDTPVEIKTSPSQPLSALRGDDAMKIDSPTMPKFEDRSVPDPKTPLAETTVSLEEERKKLDRLRRTLGEDHKDTLSSLSRMACLSHRLGRHHDAIQYEMMVMMQLRGGPGEPESREYLQSASAVAFYELEAGEHRKACERGEEVLKKQRELFGEQDIDTLITYSKLLRTYFYLGRTDDLIKQGYDVIQLSQKFKNDPDKDTVLDAKHAEYKAKSVMAEYFWTLERNEEAFEMMKDALALCVDLFGSEEPDSLWAASLLARCYSAKGDHETALEQQQEVVERCIRSLGPDHTVTINSKDNIAVFHAYLGNSEEALRISKEIVQARTKLLGDDHPDTLAAICDMATHVANAGDLKGALKIEERVLEDYRRTMGEDHPDCIRLIGRIANNYSLMGKPKEALSHGEEALRLSIQVLGQEHPHTKSLEEAVELYQTKATAHDEMDEDDSSSSSDDGSEYNVPRYTSIELGHRKYRTRSARRVRRDQRARRGRYPRNLHAE